MDKLAVWNLSHTVNYTALCRSIYNIFSLRPVVDVEYWQKNPDAPRGTDAEIGRWDRIQDMWFNESKKYIYGIPLDDERINAMINLFGAVHAIIEADAVDVRDAARDAGHAQTAGNAPRIDSTT